MIANSLERLAREMDREIGEPSIDWFASPPIAAENVSERYERQARSEGPAPD
jgi:hypothetical protein